MSFKILTVCTANICRSPVAQVILEKLLSHHVVVHSAGTLAMNGNPADMMMQQIMKEKGFIKIEEHRSQPLLPSVMKDYDLLLCMENEHIEMVQKMNPFATAKAKLLGQWSQRVEVTDPFGGPEYAYRESVEQIEFLAEQWAKKLIDLGMIS
jgi:protein-tyrosine phosphatase